MIASNIIFFQIYSYQLPSLKNLLLTTFELLNQNSFNNTPHYIHNNIRSGNNTMIDKETKHETPKEENKNEILCPVDKLYCYKDE